MRKLVSFLILINVLILSTGCFSQSESFSDPVSSKSTTLSSREVAGSFIRSLAVKNYNQFISLLPGDGLQIYRGFSSGNLGARGDALMAVYLPQQINRDLTVNVAGQTPVDIPWLFPSLIETQGKELAIYPIDEGVIDLKSPEQSLRRLQVLLADKPEMTEGAPLLLASATGGLQILVEAQLIDDALVGGLAIFGHSGERQHLLAIWDIR